METQGLPERLHVHDLLEQCALGAIAPNDVCDAIISFSKSDSAPDARILSDILLDTLFLYDSGVSSADEAVIIVQRERLGILVKNLIVSKPERSFPRNHRLNHTRIDSA